MVFAVTQLAVATKVVQSNNGAYLVPRVTTRKEERSVAFG